MTQDNNRSEFRRVVENLSSSAERQASYLEALGTAPSSDELAIEFDDAYRTVIAQLSGRASQLAEELNEMLESMSGEASGHLWTIESLHGEEKWTKVRQLAGTLLGELTA